LHKNQIKITLQSTESTLEEVLIDQRLFSKAVFRVYCKRMPLAFYGFAFGVETTIYDHNSSIIALTLFTCDVYSRTHGELVNKTKEQLNPGV